MRRLSLLLVATLLCACTEKITERIRQAPQPETVVVEDASKNSSTEKVRAEKLVQYAEQMLSPIGFFYADEVLVEALKADPENRKAQFYRALLAPLMKFRGFLSHMSEMKGRIPSRSGRFESRLDMYAASPGDLSRFLSDTGAPWKTEADIQRFLSELLVEQKKLIDFLKANKNFVARISKINIYEYNNFIRFCSIRKVEEGTYRVEPCPYFVRTPVHANRADWEALLQIWNGMRLMLVTAVSYDMDGYIDNARDARSLESLPNFGLLYERNRLAEAMPLGTELYGGLKWLYGLRERLCPQGADRSGYLFGGRVCLKQNLKLGRSEFALETALDVFHLSLTAAGGTIPLNKPIESRVGGTRISQIDIDLMALFKKPVQDLKSLFPSEYNECGQPMKLKDPTLGGVFKSGNAADFLLRNPDCKRGFHVDP